MSRHRVAVVIGTFLVLVVTAAVVTYRTAAGAGREAGLGLYKHRWTVIARLRRVDASPKVRPDIVWVGDSTIMAVDHYPSYIPMVMASLPRSKRVRDLGLGEAGMDFYAYWSIAGRIAALRPKLVVLIANLRSFAPGGSAQPFNDLTAEIDLDDLPRMLALPYYVRGMTAPGLLLARTLRTDLGEDLFLSYEGIRRNLQDAAAWDVLGPSAPPEGIPELVRHYQRVARAMEAEFDRPITSGSPLVRFAGATVARLARENIMVLVVVTPFAWERYVPTHYEPGRFATRIAMLRRVVEQNGGQLLDLHRALTKQYFRDPDCHFTTEGAAEMARLLTPEIRQLLRTYDIWAAATGATR